MNDDTTSYFLQLPAYNCISSAFIHYVVCLCIADKLLVQQQTVSTIHEAKVVSVSTGSTLSKGAVDIIHWLSFRNVPNSKTLQSLCGESKDEKRVVARGLRKVLSWFKDWNDTEMSLDEILSNPLSGSVLLDKKLRHRNIRYFVEYSSANKVDVPHIGAPDILLTMMISAWMGKHSDACILIRDALPGIVGYVRRIRAELVQLETFLAGQACRTQFDAFAALNAGWVDEVTSSSNNLTESVFKFTQKKKVLCEKVSTSGPDGQQPLIADCLLRIENLGQTLIDSVRWVTPATEPDSQPVVLQKKYDQKNNQSSYPEEIKGPLTPEVVMWEMMSLPPGREQRKIQQITSLLEHVTALLPPGGVAVEFCSGGGYVGIPLAVQRPDCTVLLTDMNSVSILYAKKRVRELGLCNVKFIRCELSAIEDEFIVSQISGFGDGGDAGGSTASSEEWRLLQQFDVGIALHACGSATDAVLRICTARGASFVVSPCCYGFLQHFASDESRAAPVTASTVSNSSTVEQDREDEEEEPPQQTCSMCATLPSSRTALCECCTVEKASSADPPTPTTTDTSAPAPASSQYPQSAAFRAQGWQAGWFSHLCRRADRTFWAHDCRAGPGGSLNAAGALAMRVVDSDRLHAAAEKGYQVSGAFMRPLEASVKNHILVGYKS